jgi:hypothetical protein
MKTLDTKKERMEALKLVTAQLKQLEKSKHPSILILINELKERQSMLNKNHEWLFNFKDGGWNSSMGKDKQEAIKEAIKTYGKDVDPTTFRISTYEDERALLSLFY